MGSDPDFPVLEETDDTSVRLDGHAFGRRLLREAGHGHDIAALRYHETGASGGIHLVHRDAEPGRPPEPGRVVTQRVGADEIIAKGQAKLSTVSAAAPAAAAGGAAPAKGDDKKPAGKPAEKKEEKKKEPEPEPEEDMGFGLFD